MSSIKPKTTKKCCICGDEFKLFRSTQKVCSTKCAIAEGKVKAQAKADKEEKQVLKEEDRSWKQRKKILDLELNTKNYRLKFQVEINKLIRIIDEDCGCISSGRAIAPDEKFDAGHFFAVSVAPNMRFNLFNIHSQSVHDNQHLGGNEAGYAIQLNRVFGQDYYEYVVSQRMDFNMKFNSVELEKLTKELRGYIKSFKKAKVSLGTFSTVQRIQFRRKYMNLLFGVDTPLFKIEMK